MAKKTLEQFESEVKELHPSLVVVGDYINNNTKITMQCKNDGAIFDVLPRSIKAIKNPCPECRKSDLMTDDKFQCWLREHNPNIVSLDPYNGSHRKITFKCLQDGYTWKAEPNVIMSAGHGCPKCGGTMRLTASEFEQRLYSINKDIRLISSYTTMRNKVTCKCTIDDTVWAALPQNLLKGHGCPTCANIKTSKRMTYTHQLFIDKVKKLSPSISVLNDYINYKTEMCCKCEICNNEWITSASNLLSGCSCPKCGIKRRSMAISKSHDKFLSELRAVNKNIDVIDEYTNTHTKLRCRCKKDGNEWLATPANLLKGTGCPLCNVSSGENRISAFLEFNGIKFTPQYRFPDCRNKRQLPFDFYCPDFGICIEFDGEQHFRPIDFSGHANYDVVSKRFEQILTNDRIKNDYCYVNNITLIRIPYYEMNRIEDILSDQFLN